jgi:hypothetical protein
MTTTPAKSLGGKLHQVGGTTAMHSMGTQACWLCGIRLPAAAMMPDGGAACADIHWYCRDTISCTQRWTQARAPSAGYRRPDTAGGRP